jgi:hypothetical protein
MTAVVNGSAARAGGAGLELARMLATLGWILGATTGLLAFLGAIPGWLVGESTSVHSYPSIQDAERRLGARILVPGYFPERLVWPPAEIRVAGGRRGSVLLAFEAHDGSHQVEFLQATRDGEPIAQELLAGRTVLHSGRTTVGAVPATISDVLVAGHAWRELSWNLHGRSVILRSAGDLEELFRMAKSAHREGGR